MTAAQLLAAALQNEIETDWQEIRRLAQTSAYANWPDVKALTDEEAKTLQVRSPYDSDERTD